MNFIKHIIAFFVKLFSRKTEENPTTKEPTPITVVTPPPPQEPEKPKEPLIPAIPITEEVMQETLCLGHYDDHLSEEDYIKPFLKQYHQRIIEKEKFTKMRNGDLFAWVALKPKKGLAVKTLQTFLIHAGIFPPKSEADGFFGYGTQAGVRLFQEYERVYGENKKMIPNGIVDKTTWALMKDWQEQGKVAKKWTRGIPSPEFNKWLNFIKTAKTHYLNHSHLIIDTVNKAVETLNAPSGQEPLDTFKTADWTVNPNEVHLIGIRRNEDKSGVNRANDDVFVLLINGMVFKFWGSTDPKQDKTGRKDEAFLVEGQHKFRFGWHNVSDKNKAKCYQGLNPYQRGVLVFRDDKITNDNSLTEADIEKGLDNSPNTTINIHWTGIGRDGATDKPTWSEGCQVIAGESYIDNSGNLIDCKTFAAAGSAAIQANKETNIKMTKGAYNMFTDLVLLYRPQDVDYIIYTLGRDETLQMDALANLEGAQILSDTLKVLNIKAEIDKDKVS
ncbi:MAG: peptidoglycan-binding domain-containing protein [Saprospiraceae bacterium]